MNNLQSTLTWCGPFIDFQPVTIGGVDPAVSIANMVLQTILGPPFAWPWNRVQASFACAVTTPATQDYAVLLTDFGHMEKAWVKDGTTSLKEMEIRTSLGATLDKERPQWIAAQLDDGAGTITFRLMSAPDKTYTCYVLYQKMARTLTSLADNWSPVPDRMSYIYNHGFLTLAMYLNNDPRAPIFNNKFLAHLLGAQSGLDQMQRNIFLGNWLEITKQVQRETQDAAIGTASKKI